MKVAYIILNRGVQNVLNYNCFEGKVPSELNLKYPSLISWKCFMLETTFFGGPDKSNAIVIGQCKQLKFKMFFTL